MEVGRSLSETPSWSVAVVITTMVVIGFVIQDCISRLNKWLIRTKRKALLAALEEIVKEMMVFGVISLLMGHWKIWFSRICVEQTKTFKTGFFACFEEDSQNSTRQSVYGFCPEGLQPFASHESLEQLHRFVLILGVVHVTYCIFLVTVAVNKINSWRTWESQAEGTSFDDVKTLIINYQSTFISRGVPHAWSQNKFLLYAICFISQFLRSIDKAGYMVLRYSFIRSHELHVSYNFHNYMLRSMEDEFRDIVGISVPLWGYAIIFILLNIHGTVAYFWLSFIPLALILIIGSKLHYIVIQLALHLENENPCKENVINPHDGLFWFGRPEYLLWLIRLNSFQNTFEMATLIWSLWEIKAPSCFIKNHVLVMIRLTLWILFQLWCSYFTFPMYVITMQMRPKLKAALVAKDIKDSINKWSKRAKYQVLQSSYAATSRASFDSMGDERDKMDLDASSITTYINSSRQFRYTSSFHNPVFSPENVASEKITGEKSSRVSNC